MIKVNEKKTKQLIVMGMLAAIAYISVMFIKIPVIMFLDYEPKDVIIAFSGIIYGPLATIMISFVVSLIEMVTISDTGPIGLLMNFLATISFALPVAILYKYKKSIKSAVIGLGVGVILMTITMIMWNIIITPFYMKVPRDVVVDLILPVFLPFNLFKGIVNSALIFLLYNPVAKVLRYSKLLPKSESKDDNKHNKYIIYNVIALIVLVLSVVAVVLWKKIQ